LRIRAASHGNTDKIMMSQRFRSAGTSDDWRVRLAGILLMLLAMTLLPLVDALSKWLTGSLHAEQITWVRNLVHALVVLPLVLLRHGLRGVLRHLDMAQGVRGLAFVLMTALYIHSLKHLALADALGIVFLFPFLVTALSPLVLGEQVTAPRWVAVTAGFVGVCLVLQPGPGGISVPAFLALCAAVMTTIYVLMTRRMAGRAPADLMLFYPAAVGALVLSPRLPAVWQPVTLRDALILLLIGCCAALVHWLIILAYRHGEASLVAPFGYFQIVMGTLLGYLLFTDLPDSMTWVGIAVIVAGGVFLSFTRQQARPGNQKST
jgi:drug/metabolite transporter (DMT)-like permease